MKKYIFIILCIITYTTIAQNKLIEKYNLMPWPKEITENNQQFILKIDFTIGIKDLKNQRIVTATTHFLRRTSNRTGVFIDKGYAELTTNNSLEINYKRVGKLELHEDESYTLTVKSSKITIDAVTDIGAIRALETLLQLLTSNENHYFFSGVSVKDEPRFPWRGLMIDAARHFQPVAVIKRNLDAMAMMKMNVFHWHLCDDQGYRIESFVFPKLHELSSDGEYYTQNQIKDVVNYAKIRGIRVIPEIDVPGHGTAILTAYPELASEDNASYELQRFAGIFNPTLNPTIEKTYEFLNKLFGELTPLFEDDYFHIGGDENEGKHWDANPNIQAFMKKKGFETNHDLQTYFNIRLQKILKKYDKKLVGWEEIMTDDMPKSALIHSWKTYEEGEVGSIEKAVKECRETLLSNGYYLDLMLPIEDHYNVDPMPQADLSDKEKKRILGGEATMWGELITPLTIDSRIWPRTAAIAERFWSKSSITDIENMKKRLKDISFKLEEVGIMHIRNRTVILRSMTNNQDVSSLLPLTDICEPIKRYTRNAGGTEYKSYSPFTLLADACTADAFDKSSFKKVVNNYLQNKNNANDVIVYLDKWINGYNQFEKLKMNPILTEIKPAYKNLSALAKNLKTMMQTSDKITENNLTEAVNLLQLLEEPFVDVEVTTLKDLKSIVEQFKKNS
ncbi:MAG: family 20 glycosylhydrolase [Flavobacteriaceae bacterium]